jgi:hypothetical protein
VFVVLMCWVLVIEDHAIGLVYLCALPRKHPNLVAYKLQEIFGVIGIPKIFHTDNRNGFESKSYVSLTDESKHLYCNWPTALPI